MIERLVVLVILFISGCTSKPFQPPRSSYEYWLVNGQDKLEVKKALLECGYPSPFDRPIDENKYIVGYKCMLKSGFVPNSDLAERIKSYNCSFLRKDSLPLACDLPWDKIPDRSIKKRLESDYCKHKLYRTYPVCQP